MCVCVCGPCLACTPSAAVHVFPSVVLKQYKQEIRKQSVLDCRHIGGERESLRAAAERSERSVEVEFIDRFV